MGVTSPALRPEGNPFETFSQFGASNHWLFQGITLEVRKYQMFGNILLYLPPYIALT